MSTVTQQKELSRLGSISLGLSLFAFTSLLIGVPVLFLIINDVDLSVSRQFHDTTLMVDGIWKEVMDMEQDHSLSWWRNARSTATEEANGDAFETFSYESVESPATTPANSPLSHSGPPSYAGGGSFPERYGWSQPPRTSTSNYPKHRPQQYNDYESGGYEYSSPPAPTTSPYKRPFTPPQFGYGYTKLKCCCSLPNYDNRQPLPVSHKCPVGNKGPLGPKGQSGDPGTPGIPGHDGEPAYGYSLPSQSYATSDLVITSEHCPPCPPGPPGHTGPKGPPGYPGYKGIRGTPGAPGLPGRHGPCGPQGEMGKRGKSGPPGQKGVKGSDGIQGSKGRPGSAGLPGAIGAPGPRGVAGSPGEFGPPGKAGPPGPRGAEGLPGLDGVDGVCGREGPHGMDGLYCPCPNRIQGLNRPPSSSSASVDYGDITGGGGYSSSGYSSGGHSPADYSPIGMPVSVEIEARPQTSSSVGNDYREVASQRFDYESQSSQSSNKQNGWTSYSASSSGSYKEKRRHPRRRLHQLKSQSCPEEDK
ncbi:unnamed protein product [Cylicocyclus nassatus]|uniref:Nematode cuticle collagen N-terminal domain-containing protein n=1 Tax=Cylicocyclus nassatus TaxID=53992 RepID=A0AA36MAV9_CYLNA|nr:unnamed protein product [Cylicocyclus nassatus]